MIKKHKKEIIIGIGIVILFFFIRAMGWHQYFSLESIKSNKEMLLQSVQAHYAIAVVTFIIVYILSVSLSLPGATVLTLSGGFLFGAILGVIYVNIGATIGATVIFILARYLIGSKLQNKYQDKLNTFNAELKEKGYLYMLTLRLIPLFPFFLINILAGLTNLPLRTFIWTTAVGIFPGSLVYTFAGKQLGTIHSLKDIFTPQIFAAFTLLGLLALLPIFISHVKKFISRKKA